MQTITREWLQELFDNHGTYKEIIQELGMDPYAGGGYRTLKSYITQYHIDMSRFEVNRVMDASVKNGKLGKNNTIHTVDTVFRLHDVRVSGATLKKLILEAGVLPHVCSECGVSNEYNGKPITLQIDHVDGNSLNNIIDNLRFLCPNCHSQTRNFGSKNRTNKKERGLNRAEFWVIKNGELCEQNRELALLVETSDIDFSKWGWSGKVASVIGKHPQKVASWMRKYMPEFYADRCYKRKTPVG